ncbi:MAG: DinB family protein [Planctomycetaceae bacterium]|nr:DinB family protein [Planctomycetaceae bacterium]
MDSRAAIKLCIDMGKKVTDAYLADLTDADLLKRPCPGINHIAWQIGHLISGEHAMVSAVAPGSMPDLPAGFMEKHSKEKAQSDNPADFLKKDEYIQIMNAQREGTLKALAALSDADLDKPVPEPFNHFLGNTGALFSMQGSHWLMHHGQWAVIRRVLGRPPLF